MTLHGKKIDFQPKNTGLSEFFFFSSPIQANVLNANKNYDAFVAKSIDAEAAINHGANAYYFEKLRLNRNKKKNGVR